ncbi:MAG: hypothetical protein JWO63_3228 [Frankiales bacterium]|nr:hypothetical protein [Frankiales bacterium]
MTIPGRSSRSRRAWRALGFIAAAGLVAGAVLGVLADRARDPGTAKRPGHESQVNLTVAFQALRVVNALNAGDTHALSKLALNDQPPEVAAQFVAAYGNRANRITSLVPSDFGGRWGDLTITVPCQGGATKSILTLSISTGRPGSARPGPPC